MRKGWDWRVATGGTREVLLGYCEKAKFRVTNEGKKRTGQHLL